MYRSGFIRLPALLVLAALVWQCGQFASFEVRRLAVKQEIKLRLKAGVPENERVNFTFSATDFEALTWVKPAREFKLNDRYYDVVVKTVDADGTVHVACIDDRQETELFADLASMVDQRMDHRGSGRKNLLTEVTIAKHWCTGHVVVGLPVVRVSVMRFPLRTDELLRGYGPAVWLPPRA